MPNFKAVRNTDRGAVNGAKAMAAMASIASAQSLIGLSAGLDQFGAAIGLPYHLMLHLGGVNRSIRNVTHNLGDTLDVEALANHELTASLVARPLPVLLDGHLGTGALQTGVAVAAPHGNTLCVLFMGCGGVPLDLMAMTERMGLVCMTAGHLVDVLKHIAPADCTLTRRQLQCLCYAAAGGSSKETARALGISPRTVEEYVDRSRRRLGAETTMAAAVQAVKRGWIDDDDVEALDFVRSRRRSGAWPER